MMSFHEKLLSGEYNDTVLADIPMGTLSKSSKKKLGGGSSIISDGSSIFSADPSNILNDINGIRMDILTLNEKLDSIVTLVKSLAKDKDKNA